MINLSKKKLRQRIGKLHLSVNKMVQCGIALEYVGSMKKGEGKIKCVNKTFNLDINFVIKTAETAETIRGSIYNAVSMNLMEREKISNTKKGIVIEFVYEEYIYNYIIVIKKMSTDEIASYDNGVYEWKK